MPYVEKRLSDLWQTRRCIFCFCNDEATAASGPLLSCPRFHAHRACMAFNSRLAQFKSDGISTEAGLLGGFSIQEAVDAFTACHRNKCHVCQSARKLKNADKLEAEKTGIWKQPALTSTNGASAGCSLRQCRKSFHYPCAPIKKHFTKCGIDFYRVFCSEAHFEKGKKKLKAEVKLMIRNRVIPSTEVAGNENDDGGSEANEASDDEEEEEVEEGEDEGSGDDDKEAEEADDNDNDDGDESLDTSTRSLKPNVIKTEPTEDLSARDEKVTLLTAQRFYPARQRRDHDDDDEATPKTAKLPGVGKKRGRPKSLDVKMILANDPCKRRKLDNDDIDDESTAAAATCNKSIPNRTTTRRTDSLIRIKQEMFVTVNGAMDDEAELSPSRPDEGATVVGDVNRDTENNDEDEYFDSTITASADENDDDDDVENDVDPSLLVDDVKASLGDTLTLTLTNRGQRSDDDVGSASSPTADDSAICSLSSRSRSSLLSIDPKTEAVEDADEDEVQEDDNHVDDVDDDDDDKNDDDNVGIFHCRIKRKFPSEVDLVLEAIGVEFVFDEENDDDDENHENIRHASSSFSASAPSETTTSSSPTSYLSSRFLSASIRWPDCLPSNLLNRVSSSTSSSSSFARWHQFLLLEMLDNLLEFPSSGFDPVAFLRHIFLNVSRSKLEEWKSVDQMESAMMSAGKAEGGGGGLSRASSSITSTYRDAILARVRQLCARGSGVVGADGHTPGILAELTPSKKSFVLRVDAALDPLMEIRKRLTLTPKIWNLEAWFVKMNQIIHEDEARGREQEEEEEEQQQVFGNEREVLEGADHYVAFGAKQGGETPVNPSKDSGANVVECGDEVAHNEDEDGCAVEIADDSVANESGDDNDEEKINAAVISDTVASIVDAVANGKETLTNNGNDGVAYEGKEDITDSDGNAEKGEEDKMDVDFIEGAGDNLCEDVDSVGEGSVHRTAIEIPEGLTFDEEGKERVGDNDDAGLSPTSGGNIHAGGKADEKDDNNISLNIVKEVIDQENDSSSSSSSSSDDGDEALSIHELDTSSLFSESDYLLNYLYLYTRGFRRVSLHILDVNQDLRPAKENNAASIIVDKRRQSEDVVVFNLNRIAERIRSDRIPVGAEIEDALITTTKTTTTMSASSEERLPLTSVIIVMPVNPDLVTFDDYLFVVVERILREGRSHDSSQDRAPVNSEMISRSSKRLKSQSEDPSLPSTASSLNHLRRACFVAAPYLGPSNFMEKINQRFRDVDVSVLTHPGDGFNVCLYRFLLPE